MGLQVLEPVYDVGVCLHFGILNGDRVPEWQCNRGNMLQNILSKQNIYTSLLWITKGKKKEQIAAQLQGHAEDFRLRPRLFFPLGKKIGFLCCSGPFWTICWCSVITIVT